MHKYDILHYKYLFLLVECTELEKSFQHNPRFDRRRYQPLLTKKNEISIVPVMHFSTVQITLSSFVWINCAYRRLITVLMNSSLPLTSSSWQHFMPRWPL